MTAVRILGIYTVEDVKQPRSDEMQSIAVSLATYTGAATLLTITPGLDTALVLRTAAAGGARQAVFAAIGIVAGCLCWSIVVALGLGALLARVQDAPLSKAQFRDGERGN
jgi:hypothetical protein